MKFGRIYSMTIQGATGGHTIEFPLTCRFQITGSNKLSFGEAMFQIYNLNAEVRSDIFRDAYTLLNEYHQVIFKAGYSSEAEQLCVVFQGNVFQAYSYRQGPDWITEIQAFDGGHAGVTSSINLTVPAQYQFQNLMSQVIASMLPTVKLGLVSTLSLTNNAQTRGITMCGNPWDLISRYCSPLNRRAYIYREKVYIVDETEYVDPTTGVKVISGDTGMIGTPRLQQAIVSVKTLFEPKIQVQQPIELQTLESRMSGPYIVQQVAHRGTISGAVCEDLYTEVSMYRPNVIRQAA